MTSEFIKINNIIINLNCIKEIYYSEEEENICIKMQGDEGFDFDLIHRTWYAPLDQGNFVLCNLHEAMTKKENDFNFHFTKQSGLWG